MRLLANARVQKVMLLSVAVGLVFLGFIFSLTTNTICNVSALMTNEIGVYRTPNCNYKVDSIGWGTLVPDSATNIHVYIRNEAGEPQFLSMSTENWDPPTASDYIILTWDYARQRIDANDVLKITLTLSVSRYTQGVSNFRFEILIAGTQNLPGDITGNGKIDLEDICKANLIYSGFVTDPELIARADLDGDGIVSLGDIKKIELMYSNAI